MNTRLILQLSLFGLAMGVATVATIPANLEPVFWLAIFLTCAVIIAKGVAQKHFLHGVGVSLANSVWITAAHVAFAETYLAHHPQEAAMAAQMSSPRLMMLVTGPLIGLASGVVLGLFALIASKIVKPASIAVS